MGSSNDGLSATPKGREDDEGAEASPRGFFGRLLSAFNSSDSSEGDQEAAALTPAKGGLLGLSNLRRLRVDDVAFP